MVPKWLLKAWENIEKDRNVEEAYVNGTILRMTLNHEKLEKMMIDQNIIRTESSKAAQNDIMMYMLTQSVIQDPILGAPTMSIAQKTLQTVLIVPRMFAPMTPAAKHVIRNMFHEFDCELWLTINMMHLIITKIQIERHSNPIILEICTGIFKKNTF